jgi:hypothetical protein
MSPRELIALIARDCGWVAESERRTDTFLRGSRRVTIEWSPWRLNTSITIDGQTLAHQDPDWVEIDGLAYPWFCAEHIPAVLRAA